MLNRGLRKGMGALAFLAVLQTAICTAAVDPQLAIDVERLRNSLPVKDPSRPTLTLRLADVLFDQCVQLGGNPLISDSEQRLLESTRKKALALYQEALKGTSHHAPASGSLALKIKFQLARLHQDLGQVEAANSYWKDLVNQEEMIDLRREASLRLAEYFEKQRTSESLKQADRYYRLSIELCGGGDVCAYGHYRLAWALREAGDLPAAIEEIQVALFDSKGQPREEAVRDLLVFLAAEKTDGERGLLLVEKLAERLNRPALFEELSSAFYSAGNRVAGTRVLEHVNQRTPALSHQVRLLEEYYGLRQWDKFRLVLDQALAAPVTEDVADSKTEKLLRRLSVQLDAERASRSEYAPDFKSVVSLHLKLFPKDKDKFKMMEGWLAAETDPEAKMAKIHEWVNGPDQGITKAEQIKLREIRLALAGTAKKSDIVESEASKLALLVTEPLRVREYRYIQSVALKEQGKIDDALALLKTWALPQEGVDLWGFRGGLLSIDILVEKKDYPVIAQVAHEWLESPAAAAASKSAKEKEKKVWTEGLAHLARVREEARFETAVAQGETPEALATFESYCLAGKFLPKSCENGRVLAVKLKKQKSILTLLQAMDRKADLAAEYEAAGFFAESAELQEKTLDTKSDDASYLKVALLYELGSRYTDRNRLLETLVARMKARKSAGELEEVVFATLNDSKMLGVSSLDLPWSEANLLKLANQLELEGKGSERTKKLLLGSTRYVGTAWSRYVLEELSKLDVAQRKISFYGRKGQQKFKSRLAAIGELDTFTEKYFAGADAKTRSRIAILLKKSYADFTAEILASPTPAELSEELLQEVKASLNAMAEPFSKKAADYEKLAREQLAQIPVVSERASLEALLLPDTETVRIVQVQEDSSPEKKAAVADDGFKRALTVLHEDPTSSAALQEIRGFYEAQGKQRLASYFQGRLLQLDGSQAKGAK